MTPPFSFILRVRSLLMLFHCYVCFYLNLSESFYFSAIFSNSTSCYELFLSSLSTIYRYFFIFRLNDYLSRSSSKNHLFFISYFSSSDSYFSSFSTNSMFEYVSSPSSFSSLFKFYIYDI